MLEEANGNFKACVDVLQQFLDPAAIEPNTVRRLTVEMRTSANALKKLAHLIEQQSGTPRTKTPPADSGVSSTGAEGIDSPEQEVTRCAEL